MSTDPIILAYDCEAIPYNSTPVISVLPNGISAGGVYGNCIYFYQFGGLSNGINFQLGFAAAANIVSGAHYKFDGGTNGQLAMYHGQETVAYIGGQSPIPLAGCGFNGFGIPFIQEGSSTRVDESGWHCHAGVWHFLEFESNLSWVVEPSDPMLHRAFVTARCWVDGRLAINWGGLVDTGVVRPVTDPQEYLHVTCNGVGSQTVIDNFYAGGIQLGGVRAQTYFPAADGLLLDWTPDSGSDHFSRVDENPVNAADYIESGTPGDIDLFEMEAINPDAASIVGGTVQAAIAGGDAGREIRFKFHDGSSLYNIGGVRELDGFSGLVLESAFWTNPATGFEFTPAEFDAGQFGVEVVS